MKVLGTDIGGAIIEFWTLFHSLYVVKEYLSIYKAQYIVINKKNTKLLKV